MEKDISVYNYSNYRSFLRVDYEARKASKPHWSFTLWAQQLGLNTGTTLSKILSGDRDPGPRVTQQLCEFFGFNPDEQEYFEDLVRLEKVKNDPRLSLVLVNRLKKKSQSTEEFQVLSEEEFQIISRWWFYGIRQLSRVVPLKNDPQWISDRLRFSIPPTEIKKAIDLMLEKGFLTETKDGLLKQNDSGLRTSNNIPSEAIKCYHESIIAEAARAVRTIDASDRYFKARTFTMNERDMGEAQKMINEFYEKFMQAFDVNDGDQVFQFQSQLFPLFRKLKKD